MSLSTIWLVLQLIWLVQAVYSGSPTTLTNRLQTPGAQNNGTSGTTTKSTESPSTTITQTNLHSTAAMAPTKSHTQELIEFCSNFTNCDSCMSSESKYNISCSWKQYDKINNENNNNNNNISRCTHVSQCSINSDYHCCNHTYCCDCLEQSSCKMCGAQGLNKSCMWDHSIDACFEHGTCIDEDKCLDNPMIIECEYPSGACQFYFSEKGTTLWTLGYLGMVIFFICLPCCLYHKCGVDWDTEFSIPINDEYALQQGDGYVFKGGAHITGRCMYTTFLCIGFLFAMLAIFGTILSISCIAESY